MVRYRLGRIVQVLGLALGATALISMGAGEMRIPLGLTAAGGLVFMTGWLLAGRGRRS